MGEVVYFLNKRMPDYFHVLYHSCIYNAAYTFENVSAIRAMNCANGTKHAVRDCFVPLK